MTTPRLFSSPAELRAAVGEPLGPTDWIEIGQDKIDLFAEATGDRQWIHTDAERASEGPFGTTIAHGYLTLSLLPAFEPQLLVVEGVEMGVNYGVNRVRFPAPVPHSSRVRASAVITEVTEVTGCVQVTTTLTLERDGGTKPVCVAETLSRYYH